MGLRIDSPNRRKTFTWYRKVLACIANSSRTVRQSFKRVILFCATDSIAKPSPSHRICREPVANPSPTLRRRSQTHRKKVSAICTMRQICVINKTISRLNKTKLIKIRTNVVRHSHVTDNIAKPSPSHRTCREPVANPSPTLRRRSQTHRKKVSAICTMRQICVINKTISRLNKTKLIKIRTNVVRHSHECLTTVVRRSHEYLTTVVRHSRECLTTVVQS